QHGHPRRRPSQGDERGPLTGAYSLAKRECVAPAGHASDPPVLRRAQDDQTGGVVEEAFCVTEGRLHLILSLSKDGRPVPSYIGGLT
ncbi:MAG TPA: hypothetical protein VH951_10645, partial [Dehalococcoidia bacterium]